MALTSSTKRADGTIVQSPAQLTERAVASAPSAFAGYVGDRAVALYTLARVVASEAGNRPAIEQKAILCADYNRAGRVVSRILPVLVPGGVYGRQGHGSARPVSTSLDPSVEHVQRARAEIESATRMHAGKWYLNPRVQYSCWRSKACGGLHQHPQAVLESWCWTRVRLRCYADAGGRYTCDYGPRQGRALQWVGPISGLDAWQLLVLEAGGGDAGTHLQRFAAASEVIAQGIRGRSSVGAAAAGGVAAVAAALLIGKALA